MKTNFYDSEHIKVTFPGQIVLENIYIKFIQIVLQRKLKDRSLYTKMRVLTSCQHHQRVRLTLEMYTPGLNR